VNQVNYSSSARWTANILKKESVLTMAMKLHKGKGFMGVPMITPDKEMLKRLNKSKSVSELVKVRQDSKENSKQ